MLNVYDSTEQKLVNIYQLFLHVIPLLIFQVKSCPEFIACWFDRLEITTLVVTFWNFAFF